MKTFLLFSAIAALVGLSLIPKRAQAAITGASTVTKEADTRTRGVRNNNPGNLEYNSLIPWRGQSGSDGRYAIFDNAVNGIRAMMIDIHTGFYRDNENTVRKIVNEWAPHQENPTENYINFVCSEAGLSPDAPLNWHQNIVAITRAMVRFENGYQPYDLQTYELAQAATGR